MSEAVFVNATTVFTWDKTVLSKGVISVPVCFSVMRYCWREVVL